MFQHQHAVAGGNGHGPAGAALADDNRDIGDAKPQRHVGGAGNGLGLAALFGLDARKCPGGIHKADDGQAKAVGKLHQPHRLAIAFGLGHAKIVFQARIGVKALFLADQADRLALEPAQAAGNGRILGKFAVAGQGREIADQRLGIIGKMRALRMAGDLRLLPWRQIGIEIEQRLGGLGFQPGQFLADANALAIGAQRAQFLDLGFEIGHRLFKIEIAAHGPPGLW